MRGGNNVDHALKSMGTLEPMEADTIGAVSHTAKCTLTGVEEEFKVAVHL